MIAFGVATIWGAEQFDEMIACCVAIERQELHEPSVTDDEIRMSVLMMLLAFVPAVGHA